MKSSIGSALVAAAAALVVFTSLVRAPEARAYEIVYDPNSFRQIGPDIFPVPAAAGAASQAMLVGQTVKATSKAVNRAHTFRTPYTEVHIIGWEIEFVITPEDGEPQVANYPVELVVTATGSIDTLADAMPGGPGRQRTSLMGTGEFTGTAELGVLELELAASQIAAAKAGQSDDPAVLSFGETKRDFAYLAADGVTKHKLHCYASTVARARVWDDQNQVPRPRAEALVDFASGSYGLSCTLGLSEEPGQKPQQGPIEP